MTLLKQFIKLEWMHKGSKWRWWKSGRVHLAEGSHVVVLELPYSTEFGRDSRKSIPLFHEGLSPAIDFIPRPTLPLYDM